ncbi:uncharacterized protein [Narcine bancroftii]|uniref:uncharacterized protein n=1 Tax=Narcine bancroftii TaxID=1343680 RepID=UPI003831EE65
MSRGTFHFVLELIEPHLKAHRPVLQRQLESGLRLAVALWWYATPCEYRSISTIFGIGVSTVCMVVQEVTAALRKFLGKRCITLPSGTRLQETIDGFAQRGYPMCPGAIDGSHIPMITPSVDAAAYYNRNGWHSVVLQAVVDHRFCFSNVFVGLPGSMHDARVLVNSLLYRKAEDQGRYLFLHDVSVHPSKLCVSNVMHACCVNVQNQRKFNKALNSARIVVEHAFGRLKGQWRCLSKYLDISTTLVPDVVFACCVLHNICEINKEDFPSEWSLVEADGPAPNSADCTDQQGHGHQAIHSAIKSIL